MMTRIGLRCAVLATLVLAVGSLGGCPQQGVNTPPVASAGANQTVEIGDTVNLSGEGSNDADGDTLSFAWTQSSGTAVTLSGANTATPGFTAPAAAATLVFELAVDDGQGGTDTDTVSITVQAALPPVTPQLFIANLGGNNVTSYRNPSAVNGNIAPDTNLAGAATQLSQPADIVVDAGGALTACNFLTSTVTSYDDAATANGNFAPDRNVSGLATLLTQPVSLAINTTSDLLFVANNGTAGINVYANASTAALNGNLAPTRQIKSAALVNPRGVNFGADDELYVADFGGNQILVFANAGNLNGTVMPTRTLTSPGFVQLFDVYVDSADRLYAVTTGGNVHVFEDASSLNGAVTPSVTLTVPGAVTLTAIAVDAAGTGYIVDAGANAVFAYDDIATLNGTLAPDRTIQGGQTQLNQPIRVFLVE